MTRLQATSVLCVALQLPATSPAASIPIGEARRVGILRVGEAIGADEASSYRLLEQRLRRWLENDPQLALEVMPIADSLTQQEAAFRQGGRRLVELSERLLALALRSDGEPVDGISELRREMEPLVEQMKASGEGGVALQKAWFTLALVDFRFGKTDEARTRLRAAASLHPDGKLKDAISWEWESAPRMGEFLEEVRRAENTVTRSCVLHLEITPTASEVFVNGFSIGKKRDLTLIPGDRYEVRISADGFDSLAQPIVCATSGRQTAKLILASRHRGGLPDPAQLRRLSEAQGVGSLILVASARDHYRLYLYTPGVAIDEFPLRRPLTARELDRGDALPIETERFSELLGRHRLAPLQLAMADDSVSISGSSARWDTGRSESTQVPPSRWYNSATFWAIAGTIVAGALVAFIATRGNSPQGGVSYTINNGR